MNLAAKLHHFPNFQILERSQNHKISRKEILIFYFVNRTPEVREKFLKTPLLSGVIVMAVDFRNVKTVFTLGTLFGVTPNADLKHLRIGKIGKPTSYMTSEIFPLCF